MSTPTPRPHLTIFATRALRDAALKTPKRLWKALTGEGAQRELSTLWLKAGRLASARLGEPESFQISHLPDDLGEGLEVVIVGMPSPESPGEAYAAMVVYQAPERGWFIVKRPARARYFTLERGFDVEDGGARAFACEWFKDGRRLRLSEVARPGPEGFLLAVARSIFAAS